MTNPESTPPTPGAPSVQGAKQEVPTGPDGAALPALDKWAQLQLVFNQGKWTTLKEFAAEFGLKYDNVRKRMKAAMRDEFQAEAAVLARKMLAEKHAGEIAKVAERHLQLTAFIRKGVEEALTAGGPPGTPAIPIPDNADEASKLMRVGLETIRLERTIHGEPEVMQGVRGTGPGGSLPIMAIVARANELAEQHPELRRLIVTTEAAADTEGEADDAGPD